MSITTPPRNESRRAHTLLLDRPQRTPRRTEPVRSEPFARPQRSTGLGQPTRKNRLQKTLGSKQVVSVRGRRVEQHKADPERVKLVVAVSICLAAIVAAAMLLSGRTTEQAFELQKLTAQETQLNNQLETLNRDVEAAKASAEITRRAADKKMVVPDQPGVLVVENNGEITEQRPSKPEATRPIIDVNGAQVRPDVASSNPKETREVTNNVNSIPQPSGPEVAPYQPRVRANQASGMGQGAQ
ncbi:hypothetical protein [Corynebacterium epidermidicanis]|uniref:Cell division protein FtsL n=1 Tax=Corynebacterium epidermidicanis TaxID=1050174 RepID=A0A0G3GVF0_9CORY|nr:hypothetical protein [Corynebacterium epidermidicanis]AKK03528.1 hypothetical protein CEPID_08390 [Corynebacterium epidermidicanis]